MRNLAYLVLAIAAVGCSRSSLTYVPPDAGGCAQYKSGGSCNADSRCQWYDCCGHGSCVEGRVPVPFCPADCTSCSGLDEGTCNATPGCRADYCNECACTPTFVACVESSAPPTTCPVFECPVLQCSCDGLDEQQCIANKQCTPNYCSTCGGTSQFSGCTGPGEPPPQCGGFCPTSCRTQNDCSGSGGVCVAPGAVSCGDGVCVHGCSSDSQCGSGQVCDGCSCCAPACTATSCPAGQTCGSDGHCAAIACTSTSQCPAYFDCVFPTDRGSPHCQRRACSGDGDCGGGAYCVDGGCYGSLGSCQAPTP